MAVISQTTFSNAFLWIIIFLLWWEINWIIFLRVQLTIYQQWFRWWLITGDKRQATGLYLNQCSTSLLTHICDTWGRWVKPGHHQILVQYPFNFMCMLGVAATGDGSNFVRISYWVFVILAPGHQGSHLKCMLFSGGYFLCEFPVCVLLLLSARVFVSGAGFWTGWTCFLCEVGI